jgi:hypothetical protein
MTPQERALIDGLFQRLKAADTPQKDREALEMISQRVSEVPSAPYLLAQTALVQEHALNGAQARIAELEAKLAANGPAEAQAAAPSFLGGLMGRNRWNAQAQAEPTAPAAAPASAPRSSVPITAPSAGFGGGGIGGGGFLQSALTTAAGVAGGALLYEGLHSMLFHNPAPFGSVAGFGGSPGLGTGGNIYETNVVNNYGEPPGGSSPADSNDGLRDASYDPSDDNNVDSDPGTDFGGSDDTST